MMKLVHLAHGILHAPDAETQHSLHLCHHVWFRITSNLKVASTFRLRFILACWSVYVHRWLSRAMGQKWCWSLQFWGHSDEGGKWCRRREWGLRGFFFFSQRKFILRKLITANTGLNVQCPGLIDSNRQNSNTILDSFALSLSILLFLQFALSCNAESVPHRARKKCKFRDVGKVFLQSAASWYGLACGLFD